MIIPSIDIRGGRAVQLRNGKDFVLESERDPVELAREFNRYGEIAVIDLDAAMGTGSNADLVKQICRVADARVGGGIRDVETARTYLRAGAKSLIIGTRASPEFLSQLPKDRVMVALDHVNEQVVDNGWTGTTGETLWERADRLSPFCSGYLVTFVENEGCLRGLSPDAAVTLIDRLKKPVTVAGGIATTGEVSGISVLGADVQVGMALYKGLIDPVECVVQSVNFDKGADSLVPTVVQDENRRVLMVAYSSRESLTQALREGRGIYFSRSRKELWEKGATSGSTQELLSCRPDCDRDSLLFTVRQTNVACHRSTYSCFGQTGAVKEPTLADLFSVLESRKREMPENSYTASLFSNRRKLLKKLMEEAYEVASFESRDNLKWEIADLLYFASVLAVDEGIAWKEIEAELAGRAK
jgi:phosphoribosyl-AMP cyclohydrolase / phosphoribosyl-ATP pyrophosphohydrolase